MSRTASLSQAKTTGTFEQQQRQEFRTQQYQNIGLNDDGSKPPLMKLAENKTWKNFASNIALPIIDGLSLADGIGELRVLYRSAGLATDAFAKGGSKLVSSEMLAKFPNSPTIGNPAETFISPTHEIDALLSKGMDREKIAKALGITDPNFLKGDLIRVDIKPDLLKNLNLRPPSGQEVGANDLFVTGGKTSGGITVY
jgi:hypothetical protein